jgi:hypothetical protein
MRQERLNKNIVCYGCGKQIKSKRYILSVLPMNPGNYAYHESCSKKAEYQSAKEIVVGNMGSFDNTQISAIASAYKTTNINSKRVVNDLARIRVNTGNYQDYRNNNGILLNTEYFSIIKHFAY